MSRIFRYEPKTTRRLRQSTRVMMGCLALLAGCRSPSSLAAASTPAAALSGPPVMSAFWGARMPRVCARVTSPPNAEQASALIQCYMDHESREAVYLIQNIQVQMDGARNVALNDTGDNIDNSAKVYNLHGSHDYYSCAPINDAVMHNTGRNCAYTRAAKTTGSCWMVHDGSYHCEMLLLVGPEGRNNTYQNQPGPTTY